MGKRSSFTRIEKDKYYTPYQAVLPLLPHLPELNNRLFYEPCVGDGRLIKFIPANWIGSSDEERDATITDYKMPEGSMFVTNPPWSREILHPLIKNLSNQAPTWLLFDSDWVHTKQSIEYMPRLRKIISIGRVKWIEDSKGTGKDNCSWYLFDKYNSGTSYFYGRVK